jgi:RHS repeat-associated protein
MVLRIGYFASRLIIALRSIAPTFALILAVTGVAPAMAQDAVPPPRVIMSDANGVDLLSGDVAVTETFNSIGPKGGGITSTRTLRAVGPDISSLDSYVKIYSDPSAPLADNSEQYTTLVLNGRSMQFIGAPGKYIAPNDEALGYFNEDANATTGIVYNGFDGTKAVFVYVNHPPKQPGPAIGRLKSITYPSGETLTFSLTATSDTTNILRVESSFGYVLLSDARQQDVIFGSNSVAANLKDSVCDNTTCSGGTTYLGQDTMGRMSTRVFPNGKTGQTYTMKVTSPSGAETVYTVSATPWSFRVSSVRRAGQTWSYTYAVVKDNQDPDADGILTTTVTSPATPEAPNGAQRIVTSRLSNGHVLSDKVGVVNGSVGRETFYAYAYDPPFPNSVLKGFGKLVKVTMPRGDAFGYSYDAYNNITSRKHYAIGSTGLFTEITAGYSCHATATTAICNQPDWTKDENGNQTDLDYWADSGMVKSVTLPARPNGTRPQTRHTYSAFKAYYNNAEGLPVWQLVKTSSCRSKATCAGADADELVTDYAYELAGGPGQNARLLSVTARAGNVTAPGPTAAYAKTSFGYDPRGNVNQTNGPLDGDADLVWTYYDSSRWVVGAVGVDPDGSGGPLKYRATRTFYRADGQVDKTYAGNVSDPATIESALLVKSAVLNEYDVYGRLVAQVSAIGGVQPNTVGAPFAVTQTNYDGIGRVNCVVQRMNLNALTSRPSACGLGVAGVDGPDRIVQNSYNAFNEVVKMTSGLSVEPIDVRRSEYTLNGKVQTEKDGEGNLTTYDYDDFDRLQLINYPNIGKGQGGSNSGDFEQYTYDAADNVKTRRLRSGQTMTFTYDGLSRLWKRSVTAADIPGTVFYTYGYDNFGNPISSTDGSMVVVNSYDALSRMTLEDTGVGLPLNYEYDAAGRRTKLTWPDSVYVTYDYYNDGALKGVYRSGTTKVIGYFYDDVGRRSVLSRANGLLTNYNYDPRHLRLSSLVQPVGGANAPDNVTFSFEYNAAGQIKTRTISNTSYVWNGAYTVDRPYIMNGLNQVTEAGAKPSVTGTSSAGYSTFAYDGRGNLKCVGAYSDESACVRPTTTYQYDAENRLRGASGGASLVYDPMGRLYQTTSNGTVTRYLYDGDDLVGEYSSSSNVPLRRYVFGAGDDEPLIRMIGLAGGGTTLEYLMADNQGSIIAATNSSGATIGKYTYDEYGIPGPTNAGLFQYTGQIYLADLGLYHYKARAYSPTLGRFLQTDPIGYADGLNWYAYVGNDPMNGTDSSGLACDDCVDAITVTASQVVDCLLTCITDFYSRYDSVVRQTVRYWNSAPSNPTQCTANIATGAGIGGAGGSAIGFVGGGGLGALAGGGGAIPGAYGGTVGGSAIGGGLGAFVGAASPSCHSSTGNGDGGGTTAHGEQRASQARGGDNSRQVGDANRVVREGRKFLDTETGATVHVNGNRVVITGQNGRVTQFVNSRANTQARIASGKWIPQ